MIGQIFKDLLDGFLNPNLTNLVKNTTPEARVGHQHRLQRNIVAVFGKRKFARIVRAGQGSTAGWQMVIKGLDGSEGGSVPENDMEKTKPIDMPPKYHET